MSFTKFLSLLDSQSLYFCRADLLGDEFECSVPGAMMRGMEEKRSEQSDETEEGRRTKAILAHNANFFLFAARTMAQTCYVNCWHMNDHESDAMWKVYTSPSEGIAIRSTPRRLVRALETLPQEVYIGKVVYSDYEKVDLHDKDGTLNAFNFPMSKKIHYKHEQELRAVIWKRPGDGENLAANPASFLAEIDLKKLIQSICVAPQARGWFSNLVASVCSKYGVETKVNRSLMVPGRSIS